MELAKGTLVRDYEIVAILGGGGREGVYKVRHRLLGIERAMRVLVLDSRDRAAAQARFLHEAGLLASIKHPSLVLHHDFGTLRDGRQYLVTELLEGHSLSARLREGGPLPVPLALERFAELCGGLEEVHRSGVVHRDINPENLMVVGAGSQERLKLVDFGVTIPSDTRAAAQLTHTGRYMGKIPYTAPEQLGLEEGVDTLDRRADLYALGVVLYHAITGLNPFHASSLSVLLQRKSATTPAPPSQAAPDQRIPQALDVLVLRMLSRHPGGRPASAEAVRIALERILRESEGVKAGGTPAPGAGERDRGHLLGMAVGEYVPEAVIGEGGMGTVYRARHRVLGVVRALKVVKPDVLGSEAGTERFLREARLLARLEHPNLVRVYDCSPLPDGSYYMVQELIKGENLRDKIRRDGKLAPASACKLFADVARGLGEAHKGGVVHRDVSPDNLILVRTSEGRETVKVIDFGIAKSTSVEFDHRTLTQTAVFMGKLQYCSPEQAGKLEPGEEIDGRSDIYSLGVVLYEVLTGRLPFEASTPQGYFAKHLLTAPPAPEVHGVELPPALSKLLLDMLAKERTQRPQSMVDVAARLDAVRAELAGPVRRTTVQRRPGGPPAETRSAARRRVLPRRLVLGAGTIGLVAAGFGFALRLGRGGGPGAPGADPTPGSAPEVVVSRPAPGPATGGEGVATTPEPVALATPEPTAPSEAAPGHQEAADKLVAEGDSDRARGRLTEPPGDSAADKYRAALALDPGNPGARDGLVAVRQALVEQGDRSKARGDLTSARRFFEKAQEMGPGDDVAVRLASLLSGSATPGQPAIAPAPSPARGEPVAATAAAREDDEAFVTAREEGSDQALARYLADFPEGRHRTEVEALRSMLAADAQVALVEAERKGTPEALREFRRRFAGAPAAILEQAAKQEKVISEDDEAFARARDGGDPTGLQAYLAGYPKGRHRDPARRLLESAGSETEEAFAAAEKVGTAEAYRRFLHDHPEAPAVLLERARQREMSARAEDRDFERGKQAGDRALLIAYLRAYPRGRHVDEVMELLDAPRQGAVALELVRGLGLGAELPGRPDAATAMDLLSRYGITPCGGAWQAQRRLSLDDFRCIVGADPTDPNAPWAVPWDRLKERIKKQRPR